VRVDVGQIYSQNIKSCCYLTNRRPTLFTT